MSRISIHGGHDATIGLELQGKYLAVELERVYGVRYFDLYRNDTPRDEIVDYIERAYGLVLPEFETATLIGLANQKQQQQIAGRIPRESKRWPRLSVKSWEVVDHHVAHAACAFYQSPFDRALVISYDGGGNDGFFRFFIADRTHGAHYLGAGINLNMGSAYGALAYPVSEIQKPAERSSGSASRNSGKFMGLAAYGRVREEWCEPMRRFYLDSPGDYTAARLASLPLLGQRMGDDLGLTRDCLSGELSADFAATATHVFEEIFFELTMPMIDAQGLPVCLVGGCALNVLVNERLAHAIGGANVFVPPNSNDCGLALGAMWQLHPPRERPDITYAGLPVLDVPFTQSILVDLHHQHGMKLRQRHVDILTVAEKLARGWIIGVARGNSEHGPRALGNRSILADASIPGLKDRLNSKIKFREAFRPYAPVVRQEHVTRYFETCGQDMRFMSFSPRVRDEWRDKLPAITHQDGTARVQTVTREQNPWLYDLLWAFEERASHGVLLNTSFNTRGKPILTTVREALMNLYTTDLDAVLIGDQLFTKEF